ncbi:MAG: hypothetical protein JWQ98_149 [Chlorobi bacterium]|nr:hypothetical protein [Chlorobiota bacterium]
MSQDHQQEILQKYLGRVVALQNERRQSLELEDLRNIARELGMSEEDVVAADAAARAHLERGMRHLQYKRWDDAVNELNDAVALNPLGVEGLHGLATAYKERWVATRREEDSMQAAAIAKRTLAIDPGHDPSYALLNELDRKGAIPRPAAAAKKKTATGWLAAAPILVVALVLFGMGFIWFNRSDRNHRPPEYPSPEVAPPPAQTMPAESTIPITWEAPKEIDMNVDLAQINTIVNTHRTLHLRMYNNGKHPFHELQVRIDDFNAGGTRVADHTYFLISGDDPPLNVNDSRNKFLEYPIPAGVTRYAITVVRVK